MTNLLLDVEPRDPAPRCPHCAALEARVVLTDVMVEDMAHRLGYLYPERGQEVRTILNHAMAALRVAAPERTEVQP